MSIRNYLSAMDKSRSYLSRAQDKPLSPCKPFSVDTLADRIEWILQNCRTDSGAKWTAVNLSRAAELADPHVGMLKRGEVQNPGNDTLEAIALVAKVSYRWLGTGQGSPTDEDLPAEDHARSAFHRLPEWQDLLVMAKALAPEIPAWVWSEVGKWDPVVTTPITAGMVVDVARLVMKHTPPPPKGRIHP